MDYKFKFVLILIFVQLNVFTAREILISGIVAPPIGTNGTLRCTFTKNSTDEITAVAFLANKLSTESYEILVSFTKSKTEVTDFGHFLSVVTSTIINDTSTEASIMLNNISCMHEREFKCQLVLLPSNLQTINRFSNVWKISVQVPPSNPNNISFSFETNDTVNGFISPTASNPMSNASIDNTTFSSLTTDTMKTSRSNRTLAEGDSVTFFCTANVGNPTRNLQWRKLNEAGIVTDYANINTTFEQITGECYYNASSEVTYTVTAEDNQAKVICLVENMSNLNSTTEPLKVHYKTRKPTITKYPDQNIYGKETTTLLLNCSADGNPQSRYLWKKNDEILGNMNVLNIENLSINNSGIYKCVANNSVRNKEYRESSFVNITVVEEIVTTTQTPTQKTTHSETVTETSKDKGISATIVVIIVVAVLVSIIVVTAIVFMIRKQKSKSKGYERTSENFAMSDNQTNKKPDDAYTCSSIDNPKQEETKENPYTHNMAHNLAYLKHEEESKSSEKNLPDQTAVYAVVNKPKVTEDPYALEQEGVYDKPYDRRHKPDENSEIFDKSSDIKRQSNLQKNTNEHEQFKETTGDRSSYENKTFLDDIIKEKGNENENSTETTAENNSNVKTSL